MLALLQRVTFAEVKVNNKIIGKISEGLLVFLGVEKNDTEKQAERLLQRVISYRIFSDDQGKMNCSLVDKNAELLVIPQFTLAADTNKGLRPSFTPAATPVLGQNLFYVFVAAARKSLVKVETGEFGAYMQVSLCNDGPVTFLLRV